MVKHVILWTLKNEYSKEEKEAIQKQLESIYPDGTCRSDSRTVRDSC